MSGRGLENAFFTLNVHNFVFNLLGRRDGTTQARSRLDQEESETVHFDSKNCRRDERGTYL